MVLSGLVSVIVPVYNVKDYLRECVQSLLRQHYRDIEILLIDDGSSDGSSDICDELALFDARVHAYHQDNCGVSEARNLGLVKARGEFVAFVDSDDIVSDRYISTMLHRFGPEADIISCGSQKIPSDALVVSDAPADPSPVLLSTSEALEVFFYQRLISSSPWGKVFRRSLIDGLRFTPGMTLGEDLEFTFMAISRSRKIVVLHDQLYGYRMRPGNALSVASASARILSMRMIEKIRAEAARIDGDLDRSASGRVFMEAVYLLGSARKNEVVDARREAWPVVLEYRRLVLGDSDMRMKNRAFAGAAYFGPPAVRWSFRLAARAGAWVRRAQFRAVR